MGPGEDGAELLVCRRSAHLLHVKGVELLVCRRSPHLLQGEERARAARVPAVPAPASRRGWLRCSSRRSSRTFFTCCSGRSVCPRDLLGGVSGISTGFCRMFGGPSTNARGGSILYWNSVLNRGAVPGSPDWIQSGSLGIHESYSYRVAEDPGGRVLIEV